MFILPEPRELCAPSPSAITLTLSRTAGQAVIGWGRAAARPCDLTLSVPLCRRCMNGGRGAREINKEDKL